MGWKLRCSYGVYACMSALIFLGLPYKHTLNRSGGASANLDRLLTK